MRVSLAGLFANVTASLQKDMREYYGFCLEEVRQHIEATVRGEHTLAEFAEHYCIKMPASPTLPAEGEESK